MIDFLISLLLAIMSPIVPAQAQNTETFQTYMSTRPSANTVNSLHQLLIMQSGTVKLGSVQGLESALITSGITRAQIATSRMGGNIIVTNGFTTAGDAGYGATYTTVGATSGGLMAIADATGQFWNLVIPANGPIPAGWFGAVCSGSGDDTVAFQRAVSTAQINFLPLYFTGTCEIKSTINITSFLNLGGYNTTLSSLNPIPGINTLKVNTTDPVYLHDFSINGAANGTPNVGDTAFIVTAPAGTVNANSLFWNLACNNDYNCFSFQQAALWVLSNSQVFALGGIGVFIQNNTNGDAGDNTIFGTLFADNTATTNSIAGLKWVSGGGLRVNNNKFLGFIDSILIAEAATILTGDLFFQNNSIENFTNSGVHLSNPVTGSSLFFTKIDNNEFQGLSGMAAAILLDATQTPWLSAVTMNGNTISMQGGTQTAIGYNLQAVVSGLTITAGTMNAAATINIVAKLATQSSTNCVFGPITLNGVFTQQNLNSCTSITPN